MGEPADEATHSKFHQRLVNTLKFPGWKKERVLQEYPAGSRIIAVMSDEKQQMKKVDSVRQIVDQDLGFVVDTNKSVRSHSKAFLFIEDKRIIGCCIAELISKAYRVISDSDNPSQESLSQGARPWCCSLDPEPAKCGINRIWVLGRERRKKIASKLLDCVRCHFLMGYPISKNEDS